MLCYVMLCYVNRPTSNVDLHMLRNALEVFVTITLALDFFIVG